jgi:hypothetical protein
MRWAKRLFYCSLIAMVLTGITARLLRGAGRAREMQKVQVWAPSLHVESHAAGPGVLAFSARATVTLPWYDGLVWFTADVRRVADDGSEASVWAKDFGETPAGWHEVKQGVPTTFALPEIKLPVQPGTYAVFIEIKENKSIVNEDGTAIEDCHGMAGDTAHVEVPGP